MFGKSTITTVGNAGFEDINGSIDAERVKIEEGNSAVGIKNDLGFFYEHLPNEMRIPILKYLVKPQDKLSMIETVPSTEVLMGWDRFAIQFEIIYPFLQKYFSLGNHKSGWVDILHLCQASPLFEGPILKHFEGSLNIPPLYWEVAFTLADERFRRMVSGSFENDHLSRIQNSCTPSTLVFPVGVDIDLFPRRRDSHCANVKTFLEGFGGKLWCVLFALNILNLEGPGTLDLLVECLRLTPNLRCLELKEFDRHWRHLHEPENPTVPPKLPHLKCINLFGECTQCQRWILPSYTHQLEVLHLHHCHLSDNFDPSYFPKLEQLSVNTYYDHEVEGYDSNIDIVRVQIIGKFSQSPLKAIYVVLEEADSKKFADFLLSLRVFEATLEILEVRFGNHCDFTEDTGKDDDGDMSRIPQLHLPKLTAFHIGGMYSGSYRFLLGLASSLTKLSIERSSRHPFNPQDLMKFSPEKSHILEESPVWRLLPELQLFRMQFVDHAKMYNSDEFYVRGIKRFTISRAEYLHASKVRK